MKETAVKSQPCKGRRGAGLRVSRPASQVSAAFWNLAYRAYQPATNNPGPGQPAQEYCAYCACCWNAKIAQAKGHRG